MQDKFWWLCSISTTFCSWCIFGFWYTVKIKGQTKQNKKKNGNKPPPNQPNKKNKTRTTKNPHKRCALWLLALQRCVTKKLWGMKSPYLTPVDKYQVHILFTPTPKGIFMSCHQRQITEVIISYLKTGPRKGDLNPFATIHESVSRNLNSTSQ